MEIETENTNYEEDTYEDYDINQVHDFDQETDQIITQVIEDNRKERRQFHERNFS